MSNNYFPYKRNEKPAGVFRFLRFEERFRKVPFSWISMDGHGPNRKNNSAFSSCSGVVGALPETRATDFRQIPWPRFPSLKKTWTVPSTVYFIKNINNRQVVSERID